MGKKRTIRWSRLNKNHRRYLIANQNIFLFGAQYAAAVEVQRVVRGYLARKHLKETEPVYKNMVRDEEREKHSEILETYSEIVEKIKLSEESSEDFMFKYSNFIQARVSSVIRRFFSKSIIEKKDALFYSKAATVIQRMYRKHRILLFKRYGAHIFIRNGKIRYLNEREDSAIRIQRCWKRFVNRHVFTFYRNLIAYRERMDPYVVLRSINPTESGLMDVASGLHVRFRLGGTKFPPVVYYKIYTHSPVVDINSFAPRDYTKYERIKEAKQYHSKPLPSVDDLTGWYQRFENNGWRPVTNNTITDDEYNVGGLLSKSALKLHLSQTVTNPPQPVFHYSSVQRKQDIVARRKKRKVEWMKKLYRAKMLREEENIFNSGAEMEDDNGERVVDPNIVQKRWEIEAELAGIDNMDESELMDVINWSQSLDFEQYVEEWTGLAITLPSDQAILLRNEFVDTNTRRREKDESPERSGS